MCKLIRIVYARSPSIHIILYTAQHSMYVGIRRYNTETCHRARAAPRACRVLTGCTATRCDLILVLLLLFYELYIHASHVINFKNSKEV